VLRPRPLYREQRRFWVHPEFEHAGMHLLFDIGRTGSVLAGVTRHFGVDRLIAVVPGVAGK